MRHIGTTIAKLKSYSATWQKLTRVSDFQSSQEIGVVDPGHLKEVLTFGSNPGALRMFTYQPADLEDGAALVVVLHGCKQTAASYEQGTGWSKLADRYGFALLLPQQQPINNPNMCFNWFMPGDTARGQGEAYSIRQMIATMVAEHNIDPARIFITGLSAGGAMTSAMLASYPEVFAGGAIIAGLPYGAARNVQEAFHTMFQSPARQPAEWGDSVRAASSHRGPWPRISIWHGTADAIVVPQNASEIAKQWCNVHGLSSEPTERVMVDGFPRAVWRDDRGEELIEFYTITNMSHGTPLAIGDAEDRAGVAGAFLHDVGISSSHHLIRFWRIGEEEGDRARASQSVAAPEQIEIVANAANEQKVALARTRRPAVPTDIGSIINQALQAAGLMKRPSEAN